MPQSELAERAHHAGCELEYLTSLLWLIIDQLDDIGKRADPLQHAGTVAQLGRLAADYAGVIADRLTRYG